ncbi:MAG: hypothetical protein ACRELX_18695 [Longimicrobiales bacterium]
MHIRSVVRDLRTILPLGLLVTTVACGDEAARSGDAATGAAGSGATSQPSYSGGSGDADLAEIEDYELTMDDLRRWSEATANFQRTLTENPEIAAALDQEESADQDVDDSLDAMAERYESVPEVRDAIEDAGLSTREFAVIFWAMMQAGMAQFAVEQGGDPEEVARELQVNPANIRFMEEHAAEIAELQQKLQPQNGGS